MDNRVGSRWASAAGAVILGMFLSALADIGGGAIARTGFALAAATAIFLATEAAARYLARRK